MTVFGASSPTRANGQQMRLCFVAHRYAPYPGGTELYVQALAEESLHRGHSVWVYSDHHRGDLNGIRVTSDPAILQTDLDLVIVHGDSSRAQKYVLENCRDIPAPVLYLLVSHGKWGVVKKGIADCAIAGWSTPHDLAILRARGAEPKACHVRHALPLAGSLGRPGFRKKFSIPADRRMFLSCGGYWPHKRMKQLGKLFEQANTSAILVTTGYHRRAFSMPKQSDKVLPLILEDRSDVLSAISEADCYLMHSAHEGFGLVLLEAMLNCTPWISHAVGGAVPLAEYGTVYRSDAELIKLIESFSRDSGKVSRGGHFVRNNHLIEHAVNDIEHAAAKVVGLPRNGHHEADRSCFSLRRRMWSHMTGRS
jgi:hypothetical protein